jgi:hypothetical protein
VKEVRPDLDDEQCYAVLQEYHQQYNSRRQRHGAKEEKRREG